jgi:hypothetical protein
MSLSLLLDIFFQKSQVSPNSYSCTLSVLISKRWWSLFFKRFLVLPCLNRIMLVERLKDLREFVARFFIWNCDFVFEFCMIVIYMGCMDLCHVMFIVKFVLIIVDFRISLAHWCSYMGLDDRFSWCWRDFSGHRWIKWWRCIFFSFF